MTQIGNYILQNEGGWSTQDLALSSLVGNVAMNLLLLLFMKKFLKTFSFEMSFLIGVVCVALQAYIYFILPFTNEISFQAMFWIMALRYGVRAVQYAMFLICLVGRVSRYLPKGGEIIGIMTIYSIQNVSSELGSVVEGYLLNVFDVRAGYYGNLKLPLYIYSGIGIFLILVLPCFVTVRVRGLKVHHA